MTAGRRLNCRAALVLCCGAAAASPHEANAAATVVANRLRTPVVVSCSAPGGATAELQIAPHEIGIVWCDGRFQAAVAVGGVRRLGYELDPYSAYFLAARDDGPIDLGRIGLGEERDGDHPRVYPQAAKLTTRPRIVEIPVALYVDEEQTRRDAIWQQEFRNRVDAAAAILEPIAGVRYRARTSGRWTTDDSLDDLSDALREFQREVVAPPRTLALGFSSQFLDVTGRTNVGGSFGPFRRHILLREWTTRIDDAVRNELLVHELAHLLGAVHSPEPTSVMRPVVGRRGRGDPVRVRFDPANALIVACVGEELRTRKAAKLEDLSPLLAIRLQEIYSALEPAVPDDGAAAQVHRMVERACGSPRAAAVRYVVQAIAQVGQAMNHDDAFADQRLGGYLRQAARAAAMTPPEDSKFAFLVGVGLGLDPAGTLAKSPLVLSLGAATPLREESLAANESGPAAQLHGRTDLAQHFCVSAALTAVAGAATAERIGIAKEWSDANGGSGLSTADLAADFAGVAFAKGVLDGEIALDRLAAATFDFGSLLPPLEKLPEGFSLDEAEAKYGKQGSRQWAENSDVLRDEVQRRVEGLFSKRE